MYENVFLSFIPLFVAIDPLGMLPVFLSLTGEMDSVGRRTVAHQAVLTAFLISLNFLLAGIVFSAADMVMMIPSL